MIASTIYLALIVAVNWGFAHVPLVPVLGEMWAPLSIAVGLIFVARDYAQRAIGDWPVVGVMLVGGLLSWWLADPFVALASITAFVFSEGFEWLTFRALNLPFRTRVLLSCAVATPIDSAIFLAMIGHFSWIGLALMVLSKMLAAAWPYLERRLFPAEAYA